MEESSVYQALIRRGVEKGRIEGRVEGEVEGELKALRLTLVRLVEQKFGGISPELEARIRETTDAAKLQAAIPQLLTITSPAELVL